MAKRSTGGPEATPVPRDRLRDTAARVTRLLEAIADDEIQLAYEIAEDLEAELRRAVDQLGAQA
jgi:hypothetical protein